MMYECIEGLKLLSDFTMKKRNTRCIINESNAKNFIIVRNELTFVEIDQLI